MRTFALSCIALIVLGALAFVSFAPETIDDESEQFDQRDLELLNELEDRLVELEAELQQLADYRDIFDNEHQYARGLDRHDDPLITSVFWPDARASYGSLVDMAGYAEWANDGHARSAAHQHFVTGLTLDIDGDTAHEEGYIFFSSDMRRDVSLDTAGVPTPGRAVAGSLTTFGTGRYVNRYERRNGEWRMIVHEYIHDISLPLVTVDLCATACLGRWDRSDISYMRPLEPLSDAERQQRAELGRQPRAAELPAGESE